MSAAVDLLLSRLDNPRPNGRDRWRCACPVCGEKNRSTLSIGIGDNGCVLVKCFKSECSADEIAAAVGLAIEDLFPPRDSSARPLARRRLITSSQALDLLVTESLIVFVVGADMNAKREIGDVDWQRLQVAVGRIQALGSEVHA